MGTWQHGRAGEPVLLQVTLGTVMPQSTTNPSPKFVTRWYESERVTLELEPKLLANVCIVDAPNAPCSAR